MGLLQDNTRHLILGLVQKKVIKWRLNFGSSSRELGDYFDRCFLLLVNNKKP